MTPNDPSQSDLSSIRIRARAALAPPGKLALSEWIGREMRLPADVAYLAGPVELWPFQPAIADAITDDAYERITLVKPTRVGFSTLITATIGAYCVNDPCPLIVYLPTEDDCRDYVVSDLEPIFEATPALRTVLSGEVDERGRNTLLQRRFPGGSLKVLAAKAPRNFRRHNARVVIFDEADGMEPTTEGSPIDLGMKRTDSFANRKIIIGSTPVNAETSNVLRSYEVSDQRIYECPCPECGAVTELKWPHIEWARDRPETACFRCPHCRTRIHERFKVDMVTKGSWRITNPAVRGHAGFRMNALISLLPNTTWAHLAQEWIEKHRDPDTRQVFVNTRLAEGWREAAEELDEKALAERVEGFSLDRIPAEVLALTTGIDVQGDRLEVTFLGHGRPLEVPAPVGLRTEEDSITVPQIFVAGHEVVLGKPEDPTTWEALDELLARSYAHPLGGRLKVSSVVVDAGNWQDEVCDYCFPRSHRKVFAAKGVAGFARPAFQASTSRKKFKRVDGFLHLMGVDVLKQRIFTLLPIAASVRFSASLTEQWPDYFDELTNERKVIKYVKGQPVFRFERRNKAIRVEKLDCLAYAIAAREAIVINWDALEERLTVVAKPKPRRSLAELGKEIHAR